jgi:archaellum component FlaC
MPPRIEDVYKMVIGEKRKLQKIESDLNTSSKECARLEHAFNNLSEQLRIANERNLRIRNLYESKAKELDSQLMHLYQKHEKFYVQGQ